MFLEQIVHKQNLTYTLNPFIFFDTFIFYNEVVMSKDEVNVINTYYIIAANIKYGTIYYLPWDNYLRLKHNRLFYDLHIQHQHVLFS